MKKRYYDEVEAEVNEVPGMGGGTCSLHPFTYAARHTLLSSPSHDHRAPRASESCLQSPRS